MRTSARGIAIAFAVGACFAPLGAHAYNSGSTGADGPLNPTVDTPLTVPPSGIFNFSSINIPAGVTVRFVKNTANTPVVFLVSGDVTIAGTIFISGTSAPGVGAAGDGVTGDDGTPGRGGAGGFDGGRGGLGGTSNPGTASNPNPINRGGGGLGPGGGNGGLFFLNNWPGVFGNDAIIGGVGGAFAASTTGTAGPNTAGAFVFPGIPGATLYGSDQLLPLIGGSGGGGGGGGTSAPGAGGGGGGGAILIAASGTVNIAPTGAILANGGAGGGSNPAGDPPVWGATGGGGAGGAIRIAATTITGNGLLQAIAGPRGEYSGVNCCGFVATVGSPGRIRLEAENYTRTAVSNPVHTFSNTPAPAFIAGTPTLRIASVAGQPAPANPTGSADITLPSSTPNPVTVAFETSGVPVGNTVELTVTPAFGPKTSATSPALTGTTASATASVSIDLPTGPSVLSAQTRFTVVAAVGDLLRNFAGNERVESVTLVATLGGPSKAKLITVSGREYEVPTDVLRIAALGG